MTTDARRSWFAWAGLFAALLALAGQLSAGRVSPASDQSTLLAAFEAASTLCAGGRHDPPRPSRRDAPDPGLIALALPALLVALPCAAPLPPPGQPRFGAGPAPAPNLPAPTTAAATARAGLARAPPARA